MNLQKHTKRGLKSEQETEKCSNMFHVDHYGLKLHRISTFIWDSDNYSLESNSIPFCYLIKIIKQHPSSSINTTNIMTLEDFFQT